MRVSHAGSDRSRISSSFSADSFSFDRPRNDSRWLISTGESMRVMVISEGVIIFQLAKHYIVMFGYTQTYIYKTAGRPHIICRQTSEAGVRLRVS
jgi:hypothetical protein